MYTTLIVKHAPPAARRAESGIGQILRQSPGFRGYFVFDAGDGVGGSVTLFEDRETATEANRKALNWIQASLSDLLDGDPEIIAGEVLVAIMAREDAASVARP